MFGPVGRNAVLMSPTNKQTQKFIDKAREFECDEDEAVFDDKLRRIAQSKPEKGNAPDE